MFSEFEKDVPFKSGKKVAFSRAPMIPPLQPRDVNPAIPPLPPLDVNPVVIPPVQPHGVQPMEVNSAAGPILNVLRKSKIALTSFKRNQTRMKKKAAARLTKALSLSDEPFSSLFNHKVEEADTRQPPDTP